ncbi:glycosyltransferase family protein [Thermodesulforhabdus norvegica]|uniref:Predicted glycosyl transferase n=1 Tax=Thermodesulforhabdus norvegica TaxID=39841 RepID=A0A1I4T7Z5_9BACT|nr:glycosyltransferase [Thermodesulforhabdus norvegica]SFM72819.1 Predicted glycosyl transferase [Thermodesulforhabdus norvegica]
MKVLLYCQHVLGVGHLYRSLEIARALQPHEVIFIEGGRPIDEVDYPGNVRILRLPALMMDENFERLFSPDGEDLEAVKNRRKEVLLETCRHERPDVCVIELFPFGRKKFRFELVPLLEMLRRDFPDTLVVSSIRDILVEKKKRDEFEKKALKYLKSFFDLVLVHSDPRVITLQESFARFDEIPVPVEYTGYVVRKPGRCGIRAPSERSGKRIVVSNGGGSVGHELIETAIDAFGLLPLNDVELDVFPGPFMPEEVKKPIESRAARYRGIRVNTFSRDFVSELLASDLSISMAGYNTMMDLLSAGVFGLVYPFKQNREQALRARRFEKFGVVRCIEKLDAEYLAGEILRCLDREPHTGREYPIDTDGALSTKRILERYSRQKKGLYRK